MQVLNEGPCSGFTCEFGGLYFDEGRVHELSQSPSDLRLAAARWPDHQNVARNDLLLTCTWKQIYEVVGPGIPDAGGVINEAMLTKRYVNDCLPYEKVETPRSGSDQSHERGSDRITVVFAQICAAKHLACFRASCYLHWAGDLMTAPAVSQSIRHLRRASA